MRYMRNISGDWFQVFTQDGVIIVRDVKADQEMTAEAWESGGFGGESNLARHWIMRQIDELRGE